MSYNLEMNSEIYVIKRDGRREEVQFDKVKQRIKNKSNLLNVNPTLIAQRVCTRIYDGVSTAELDELAAQICTSFMTEHPDYGELANRIIISNNQKTTPNTFIGAMELLYNNVDGLGKRNPLVSEKLWQLCETYGDKIEGEIDYSRDYLFDYFGFKTLQRSYLMKIGDRTIERIQHMFMRVSLGLHSSNINDAFKSYHLLSRKYFTHATPTLYHSGTPNSQCLSCFLLGTGDSVDGMYKTISDCAKISKWAGGIGIHVSNIRSRGSYIRGNNGESSGLIPMLRVYNATARHINQAGKRNGSIAVYLEPYHPDVMDFLDLRKNNGNEEARARDLFLAMMVPDLFMEKVEYALKHPNEKVEWCLFDPDECRGLNEVYGQKFRDLYEYYEEKGKYREKIDITKLWKKILGSQIETGTPYMVYKDRVNEHSNQKNIGTIKSSNLCVDGNTEVITKDGYSKIRDLEDKSVDIWNGFEFSNVVVKKTGEDVNMHKIEFTNGEELICTPYHKFYMKDAGEVRADDLISGMQLIDFNFPVMTNGDYFEDAYLYGFLKIGFGGINFIEKAIKKFTSNYLYEKGIITNGKEGININADKDNFTILEYDIKSRKKYLQGVIDYNGTNIIKGEHNYLIGLKKIVNSMGLHMQISDGCVIIPDDLNIDKTIKISSVHKNYKTADTYCFNEEKRHFGVFNRILTGQCSEIVEYSDENEYACCCLASIALSEMVKEPELNEKVVVYSRSGCGYCVMACEELDKRGVEYEKIMLDDIDERKKFYNEMSGVVCEGDSCKLETPKTYNGKRINTVPQIFIGERHVGGYTELMEYLKPQFDYGKLEEVCEVVVRNLNQVIDINYYPVVETKRSNFRHRPLGVGVQGLADLFFKMRMPYDSEEARDLNKKIFEAIQYYCLSASCSISEERDIMIHSNHFRTFTENILRKLMISCEHTGKKLEELEDLDTKIYEYRGIGFTLREILNLPQMRSDVKYGGSYITFKGSPLSKGIFQFESMGIKVEDTFMGDRWNKLRKRILNFGVRNSLLVALMPTASTSQILGNNECFEPITSNIYSRRTIAGDFVVINKFVVRDLLKHGKWNKMIKDEIIGMNGSVQELPYLTEKEKALYKTVWEIKQKVLIDMSADRTPFVCQTQSLNLFFEEPKNSTLGSALIYGWKSGLKTGSYYIRSRPKVQAQQFTLDPSKIKTDNYEVCESCSG